METIIKYTVNHFNGDTSMNYELLMGFLAVREYEFSVKREWISSVCVEFTITVVDMCEDDLEYAKYRLGVHH